MKYIFLDERIDDNIYNYFKSLNYEVIKIPKNDKLYDEISSHTDIHICKVSNKLIMEPSLYNYLDNKYFKNNIYLDLKDYIEVGNRYVESKYPNDILYNAVIFNNTLIHNLKYTDEKIINKFSNKINVKQGYTNCSSIVLKDRIITCDKGIYNTLIKNNINCYYFKYDNIKLLKKDNSYSNMQGFLGGSCVYLEEEDVLVFFGKLDNEYINKFVKIKTFDNDLIDYGKGICINTGKDLK